LVESIYDVLVEAPYPTGKRGEVASVSLKFARKSIERIEALAQRTEEAQALLIIIRGMKNARHIFRGLGREVHDGSNIDQGPNKLIYAWSPGYDFIWLGDPHTGRISKITVPVEKSFLVIVSPNSQSAVDGIAGWIERWNWAAGDLHCKEAPIGYKERYNEHIWTRP
jgi:hypothetical protein